MRILRIGGAKYAQCTYFAYLRIENIRVIYLSIPKIYVARHDRSNVSDPHVGHDAISDKEN